MCLKTHYTEAVTAEEDITVYKMLIHSNGRYLSPFQAHEYTLDVEETAHLEETGHEGELYPYLFDVYMIDEGLHSFTELSEIKDAVKYFMLANADELKDASDGHTLEIAILKAIIPKGAKYYLGEWNTWGNRSYHSCASDKLIVTSEVVSLYGTKWYQLFWNKLKCAFT